MLTLSQNQVNKKEFNDFYIGHFMCNSKKRINVYIIYQKAIKN